MTQVISSGAASGAGHHASAPSDVIPFAGPTQWWKLTLDVNAKHRRSRDHDADEKLPTELTGYTLVLEDDHGDPEPHFDVVVDDGHPAVRFRSYVDGALTGGTKNPRTELREMTGPHKQDQAAWPISNGDHATHRLTATVKVTSAPTTHKYRRVAIGQIHTGSDDLVEIQYDAERNAVGFTWPDPHDPSKGTWQDKELIKSYTLGAWFGYRIEVSRGTVVISVDTLDGHGFRKVDSKDASATGCFFKAGAYTQCHMGLPGAKADDYGEALFRSVVVDGG